MPGKVILTADDYGACEFVDNGILKGIAGGHINTVSAFVTHERSQESISRLVQQKHDAMINNDKNFNIGLHFSITSGYTLQNGPNTLTKELRNGQNYFHLANYYDFGRVNMTDLQQEIIAQLTKLDALLGEIKIDHVAVHHGITYLQPHFFQTFIETVRLYRGTNDKYVTRPIAIRSPRSWYASREVRNCCYNPETGDKILFPGIGTQGLALGYWRKVRQTTNGSLIAKKEDSDRIGLHSPDYLVDVIYNQACTEGIECVLNEICNHDDIRAEFMFHLGFMEGGDEMSERDFMLDQRLATVHGVDKDYFFRRHREELDTISNEMNLGERLKALGIQIISYGDL